MQRNYRIIRTSSWIAIASDLDVEFLDYDKALLEKERLEKLENELALRGFYRRNFIIYEIDVKEN